MRSMTEQENELSVELFGNQLSDNDGKTHLTIRFDTVEHRILKATGHRWPMRGATLLQYVEKPDRTPTGGRFTARRLRVRTANGKTWVGQMKNGTDVVRLRLERQK
jgi:hypothetical protein